MFSSSRFSRILTAVRGLNTASTKFGDPRMPDKLYKTVELEVRGAEPAVMKSYETFVTTAAKHLNITVDKVFSKNKPNYKKFTVLKSVFGHRKHLVQYEIRTHYTWIHLKRLTGSTADTFLEYVERMLPEGVAMKVTKVEVEAWPGHLSLEELKKGIEN